MDELPRVLQIRRRDDTRRLRCRKRSVYVSSSLSHLSHHSPGVSGLPGHSVHIPCATHACRANSVGRVRRVGSEEQVKISFLKIGAGVEGIKFVLLIFLSRRRYLLLHALPRSLHLLCLACIELRAAPVRMNNSTGKGKCWCEATGKLTSCSSGTVICAKVRTF